LSSTLPTNKH